MPLPTGEISASDINLELGRLANATFSMDGTQERALAGVPSGEIKFSDFQGKSNGDGGRELNWTAGTTYSPPLRNRKTTKVHIKMNGTVSGEYTYARPGSPNGPFVQPQENIGRWSDGSGTDTTQVRWVKRSGSGLSSGVPENGWVTVGNGATFVHTMGPPEHNPTSAMITFEFRRPFNGGYIDLGTVDFTVV